MKRRTWWYLEEVWSWCLDLALIISLFVLVAICAGLSGCGGGEDEEPRIVCTEVPAGPYIGDASTICKEQK